MSVLSKVNDFKFFLTEDEKSDATIEKYLRDVRFFGKFISNREITKQEVMEYKKSLVETYAPASVNSMLVSLNSFLHFINRAECCVKLLKIQRQMFVSEKKELTAAEYRRLLKAAQGTRLELVIQTICETGIRVSELKHITVEAVEEGKAVVDCKNKTRVIFIPTPLRKRLLQYIKKSGIEAGSVFVTKTGRPLNRSNIWRDIKSLCKRAEVSPCKAFPHNLRHLFARTFYSIERDIVRLADLLGHSSINTTRIYTIETGKQHLDCLERMHRRLMT
ncbi:MAG: tyrosine-type recombinase/integrase [Clostridia bacterium]|nr:tyrosine-type recombinase/integrase [Clostridia bacterium]